MPFPRSAPLSLLAFLLSTVAWSNDAAPPSAALPEADLREPKEEKEESDRAAGTGGNKVREGTFLKDSVGVFRSTGDRLAFQSADGRYKLVVLENLALERVGRVLKESGSASHWLVSGTVTEYQGTNYLLVTRAVLKHRKSLALDVPPPKAP